MNKENQEEERVPVKEMAAVKAEEPRTPERPGNSSAEQQEGAFASSSLDAWFKSQQRDLHTIMERSDGTPVKQPSQGDNGQSTPQSMKDWESANRCESITTVDNKKAPESTTTEGFDLWMERQRKELQAMTNTVEQARGAPLEIDTWKAELAAKSNKTLDEWRKKTLQEDPKGSKLTNSSQEALRANSYAAEESIRELQRSLMSVTTKSESHKEQMDRDHMMVEEVQFTKLHNLSARMEQNICQTSN